ncbi:MAG TPA: CAP domain-containing protein [Candidatus Dormibacteraeota bacterium]|nr:CAP domain-containing protein [Candidatus Dormibacteraeota bacterium]
MHFSLVDPVLLAGAALLVAHAVRRGGFVPYLTELIAFGLGLAAAFVAFGPMGDFVHARMGVNQGIAGFGSFLLVLVVVHAVVQATVGRVVSWMGTMVRAMPPESAMVAHGLPAVGVAAGLITLVLAVAIVLPIAGVKQTIAGSIIGGQVLTHTGPVQGAVARLLAPPATADAKRILESDPASNPGEDAFLKLQFPADLTIQPDPAGEDRMLQLVNQARAQVGLSPLRGDTLLQQAAREHSSDMYKRHYFSHRTPDGKSPYDRLHDLRFHYVTAGENLAFAPDVDQAFDSLMKSPDHKANILNPDYRCVGIGAYKGLNGYEEMFTQDFSDCS